MRLRATALALTWAAFVLAVAPLTAQQPPGGAGRPVPPPEVFRSAQEFIQEGRYDVAAEELKRFLAANPSDKDLLDLQQRDATIFQRLRNVPVWFDEPNAQAEAVKTVEAIIARAEAANRKLYRDSARITRFVRNLAATPEERAYAIQELVRAGDAAVPVMVDVLRTASDVEQRAGIYLAIRRLGPETVPGFLGAAEGLTADVRLGVLRAIAARPDVLNLLANAETDFAPHLWYYVASQEDASVPLRGFAAEYLRQLAGGRADRARPENELVRIATTFENHAARFRGQDRVTLWTWDPAKQAVVSAAVPKPQAEDYYALKYAKWALDIQPNHEPAQDLFLVVSVGRAVERGGFRDLAETDPGLYPVLAATPSERLIELANQAMARRQTALAFGLVGVLATRADRAAAAGTAERPGLFVRALDYPDPRVQLAAAHGLLRSPPPHTHGKAARVVEVLRRALNAEPAAGPESGRVLIADPLASRGGKLTHYFRRLGYAPELFTNGRDLMRRVSRAADFDLIVVDRHVYDPLLPDLLPQLQADPNAGRRPILVVASADKPREFPLEHLLLRLAVLIGASEVDALTVPPPFFFDPRKVESTDLDRDKAALATSRDQVLAQLYGTRAARLRRLVDAANLLPVSRELLHRLELRIPQVTSAALAAQYPITPESAPDTAGRFRAETAIILGQPVLSQPLAGLSTDALASFAERLEAGLNPEQRERFESMYARIDPGALGFPPDNLRDPDLEFRLRRAAEPYPVVTVIPEPFGLAAFTEDVRAALSDPATMPRDTEEKRRAARLAAELLRRIAIGEVTGYDVRPAGDALRAALRSDDLAPIALDAVGRIPTAVAQQDMLNVALGGRPDVLRSKAADLTIQHIQTYGRLVPVTMVTAIQNAQPPTNELKSKFEVIRQLLVGKPGDLGALMTRYPVTIPQPPAAANPPVKPEPAPTPDAKP